MKGTQFKKVGVIGMAKSGIASAKLLKHFGADVFVSEISKGPSAYKASKRLKKLGINFELGKHSEKKLEGSDIFILSPGVSANSPIVKFANKKNIPLISEIELGYGHSKGSIIAVGGTNGKTTVTTLIGEIFKNAGRDTFVCGNIGTPFTAVCRKTKENSVIVLEVSSFQLEAIKDFKPKVSIILNITQDHLDRYKSMDDYRLAKARAFINQDKDDYLVLNYDDKPTRMLANKARSKVLYFSRVKKVEGAFLKDGAIFTNIGGKKDLFCKTSILKLQGSHNIENCMAAIISSLILGVGKKDIIKTLKNFKTLSHRIEYVDSVRGVKFIDDSKATNVDGVRQALKTFNEPIILIAGGLDKNSDFTELGDIVKEKVKALILIGAAREKIRDAFSDIRPTFLADTMDDAVKNAFQKAAKGDVVLLSPLCASFDMFRDYKHRGEVFKKSVKELKKHKSL